MKKQKLFAMLFIAAMLCVSLAFGISAADNVVYLADGANGDGSSPSSPMGDLADAYVALPYGGTIVVTGDYTLKNSVNYDASLPGFITPAADGTIVITGKDGDTDYGARLICPDGSRFVCTANTTFEDITLYNGKNKTFVISGRFFHLTFGRGTKMESIEVHVVGGLDHTNSVISVPDDDYTKDAHVTVLDGTIAGSSSNLHEELKNVVSYGMSLEDAIKALTETPAKAIGEFDSIGSIDIGKAADMLLLDEDLELRAVIIDGEVVLGSL